MSPLDLEKMKYLYDNVYNPRRITQEALSSPGVDVNWKNIEDADRTLLIQAINSAGSTEGFEKMGIVKLLLDNGVDINARDDFGRSAYDYAVLKKYTMIQDLLTSHGASVGGRKGRKSRKIRKGKRSRRNRRTKRR
jgi:hypothetical protein